MASEDSSFNAHGQTVVAFETTDLAPNAPRDFGVAVSGLKCGVQAEGMTHPEGVSALSVSGAGVYGRGDAYGVYGIDGAIKSSDAPDPFSSETHGIGVFGVSRNATAVVGDHGVLRPDMQASPNRRIESDLRDTIAGAKVGVAGVSAAGGGILGVAGIAGFKDKDNNRITHVNGHDALDFAAHSPPSDNGLNGFNSGVTAIGAGPGPGIYAVSSGGRGGIFQSFVTRPSPPIPSPHAQILLVPTPVDISRNTDQQDIKTPRPVLPFNGQAGDMMAVMVGSERLASLWFCVQGFRDQEPALWAEIAFVADKAIRGSA